MKKSEQKAVLNTDKEIWREEPDNYYSPSIFVTQDKGIGINCAGGPTVVKPITEWHKLSLLNSEHEFQFNLMKRGIQHILEGALIGRNVLSPPDKEILVESLNPPMKHKSILDKLTEETEKLGLYEDKFQDDLG